MFRVFYSLLLIIWLVDILNINYVLGGVNIANFLDNTLPLNFWFWLLLWILIPTSKKD